MGVILGAWLMSKDGWPMVWVAAIVAVVGSVIDMIWGDRIGRTLADITLSIFAK